MVINGFVTLFLSGDVMTGRGIDQALPRSVHPRLFEPYIKDARRYVQIAETRSDPLPSPLSYDYIWGDALEYLNRIHPDVSIINLETAITNSHEHWPGKYIHYRMHPKNVVLFEKANIDVCVLGNNHVMDWGRPGLHETLSILTDHGFVTAGAGHDSERASKPAIVGTETGRLLIFSYACTSAGTPRAWKASVKCSGVNLLDSLDRKAVSNVVDNVQSYRQQGDRVIISIHWGNNWGYEVPSKQRSFAHYLLDHESADIIHGHSSHHPKGIEVYKGRLILYGCGDLINDYEGISGKKMYRGDLSLLYFPKLGPSGSLHSLKMMPMQIRRFRLNRVDEDDAQWLAGRLNREGKKTKTTISRTPDDWLNLCWKA